MNLEKLIREATHLLKKNFIKSADLDSEILMSKVINENRDYVILNLNKNLDKKKLILIKAQQIKDLKVSQLLIQLKKKIFGSMNLKLANMF